MDGPANIDKPMRAFLQDLGNELHKMLQECKTVKQFQVTISALTSVIKHRLDADHDVEQEAVFGKIGEQTETVSKMLVDYDDYDDDDDDDTIDMVDELDMKGISDVNKSMELDTVTGRISFASKSTGNQIYTQEAAETDEEHFNKNDVSDSGETDFSNLSEVIKTEHVSQDVDETCTAHDSSEMKEMIQSTQVKVEIIADSDHDDIGVVGHEENMSPGPLATKRDITLAMSKLDESVEKDSWPEVSPLLTGTAAVPNSAVNANLSLQDETGMSDLDHSIKVEGHNSSSNDFQADESNLTIDESCIIDYHVCHICEYKSRYKSNLQRHLKVHSDNKESPKLPKAASKQEREHTSISDNIYTCDECDYSTMFKHNLTRHRKNHSQNMTKEMKPLFVCKHCDKELHSKYALKLHCNTLHDKIYKFECPTCHKGFNQRHHFKGHVAAHHKKLKEKCTVCSATFAYKQSLTDHMKNVHTGVTFTCPEPMCNVKCSSGRAMREHRRAEHEGVMLSCFECSKTFKWRSSLIYHTRHAHNVDNTAMS